MPESNAHVAVAAGGPSGPWPISLCSLLALPLTEVSLITN